MTAIYNNKTQPMRIKKIHFIGIGGSGMGGIAEVLYNLGYDVSGSDIAKNRVTKHLKSLGIKVYIGHKKEQLNDTQAVVISSAIKNDNPEFLYARENRIPIVPRAEMLAELMRFRYGIAVSGTHGKTTTTSLIAHILATANLDPTFIIGGVLNNTGTNAKLGGGSYLVAEADESDASFLHLQPMLSIVTNIDLEHMQTYQNDLSKLENAFLNFISNLPFYGLCILCIDDKGIENIISRVSRSFISYGFSNMADFQAIDINQKCEKMYFKIRDKLNNNTFDIELNLIGRHNILNTLAAIITAIEIGVSINDIKKALKSFQGVSRRLERHGILNIDKKKISLIDDYGHHPNEIKEVIKTIKNTYPNERLIIIFQPHRFSRTRDLFDDFVNVLSTTDALILLNIYPASEKPIANISSHSLAMAIRERGKVGPIVVNNNYDVIDLLPNIVIDGDIVLTLGAGDIGKLAKLLKKAFND